MSEVTNIVRTIITMEILHEKDFDIDQRSLEDIAFEITEGCASGREISLETSDPLSVEELTKACEKHGTDPTFFLLPEDDVEALYPSDEEEAFDTGDFDE